MENTREWVVFDLWLSFSSFLPTSSPLGHLLLIPHSLAVTHVPPLKDAAKSDDTDNWAGGRRMPSCPSPLLTSERLLDSVTFPRLFGVQLAESNAAWPPLQLPCGRPAAV